MSRYCYQVNKIFGFMFNSTHLYSPGMLSSNVSGHTLWVYSEVSQRSLILLQTRQGTAGQPRVVGGTKDEHTRTETTKQTISPTPQYHPNVDYTSHNSVFFSYSCFHICLRLSKKFLFLVSFSLLPALIFNVFPSNKMSSSLCSHSSSVPWLNKGLTMLFLHLPVLRYPLRRLVSYQ